MKKVLAVLAVLAIVFLMAGVSNAVQIAAVDYIGKDGPVTSVPEPTTLVLVGIGLVGLGSLGRSRFKR